MKKLITLLAVTSIVTNAFSQENELTTAPSQDTIFTEETNALPDPKVTFDIDLSACFTTGEFKQFYPKDGMGGFGATVLMPLHKKNPLDIGFELGYYFMSNTSSTFQYYTPGMGDYEVNSSVSGTMLPFHLVARIYPLKGINLPIQPYVEGVAGFRLFIVEQELTTTVINSGVELEPQKESTSTGSWSYGFGAGVKVIVSKNNLVYLNAKVNQLYGTATNYMDPTTIILYDDGSYEYLNYRSRTDVLRFSFGIHVMLE